MDDSLATVPDSTPDLRKDVRFEGINMYWLEEKIIRENLLAKSQIETKATRNLKICLNEQFEQRRKNTLLASWHPSRKTNTIMLPYPSKRLGLQYFYPKEPNFNGR